MKRRQTDPWNFLFIAECGSRICSTTTSDARKCASFLTPRSRARSASARTTPAWVGGRSSKTCIRTRLWPSGTRPREARNLREGQDVNLESFEHSLKIDSGDAARVRHLEHDVPLTAAEEDRARRKKAYEEQAKVRAIYEEAGAEEASAGSRADWDGQRHREGGAG